MRSAVASGIFSLLLASPAAAETREPGTTPAQPPQPPIPISCEAGFEESFGDRPRSFYTIEFRVSRLAPRKPDVLFTHWTNKGTRAYYTNVVTQRKTS